MKRCNRSPVFPIRLLCLLGLALCCAGCAAAPAGPETAASAAPVAVVASMPAPAPSPATSARPQPDVPAETSEPAVPAMQSASAESYTAWLPYWEAEDALSEAASLGETLDTAVAFAAIFDRNGRPFLLPEAEKLLKDLAESESDAGTRVLLSVVNDVETSPGSYDNKSTALLKRLFHDDASISRHIEQLFALVDTYHLAGLEIDYENIKADKVLWAQFMTFVERLYAQFSAQGLRLRVVLSWDTPKYTVLPDGPEYSVMCYNLYGGHSGPGPKADLDFLETTCGLYKLCGPNVHMAFATGGFDWSRGKVDQLTQRQAEALLASAGVTPTRDLASGALYAAFTHADVAHTLWYADAQTLSVWQSAVAKHGFSHCDLFRLGGNDLDDWRSVLMG